MDRSTRRPDRVFPDALCEALRLYHQIGATGHARRLEAELSGSVRAL